MAEFQSRTPRRSLSVIAISSLVSAAILASFFVRALAGSEPENFEELALGKETVSMYAAVDGNPIHCKGSQDAARCLDGHERRGRRLTVLWLGNSQLHAINQIRPGDQTASALLFRELRALNLDLLTFSQPNANLQEHLVLFASLQQQLPLRFLVLPIVFDDLRNSGVRSTVSDTLATNESVDILDRYQIGKKILAGIRADAKGELAALDQTVQEIAETTFTVWLEQHSALWAQRPQARGNIQRFLMSLRNFVFGITAQTKRKMLPGAEGPNLAAAAAILKEAKKSSIKCVLYIPPLRNDVETPYIEEEYERFKQEVEDLAKANDAVFANLETLVPENLWGKQNSTVLGGDAELDFMHFQAGGHKLLAAALGEILERELARELP
jgi:hypothetical protein